MAEKKEEKMAEKKQANKQENKEKQKQKRRASREPSLELKLQIEMKLSEPGWEGQRRYITSAGTAAMAITTNARIPESFVKICRHKDAVGEQTTPPRAHSRFCRFKRLTYKPRVLNLTDEPED
nr:uncharacterized protein LOC6740234 [Drosophila simulans]